MRASHSNGVLRLSVKDTGRGIPKHLYKRIFNSAYQTGSSDSAGGIGLDLAIVKQYIALHRGSVSVHSEPGVASEFTVEIPDMTATAAPSQKRAATGQA